MTDVTGESFPALMHRLVLRPAGMSRSTFAQPLPKNRAGEAALAYRGDGKLVPGGYHSYPEMAAAGLWTTPSDLARWALAISGAYQGKAGSVLAPRGATAMLTPGMGDWGLGLSVRGEGEWLEFWHNGANEGYRTNLLTYPRRGEGAVVMTNGDNGGPLIGAVMLAVAKTLGWPRAEPRIMTPATITAEERAAVLGRYKGETVSFTIAQQGDRLIATPSLGNPFELIPLGKDAYGSPDIGMRVQFQRGPDGKVTGVSGGGLTLKREP
jgi:CubicO group peptidase (beta-lactamase class C family)